MEVERASDKYFDELGEKWKKMVERNKLDRKEKRENKTSSEDLFVNEIIESLTGDVGESDEKTIEAWKTRIVKNGLKNIYEERQKQFAKDIYNLLQFYIQQNVIGEYESTNDKQKFMLREAKRQIEVGEAFRKLLRHWEE